MSRKSSGSKMTYTTLNVTQNGPVAHVQLCRPEVLNVMVEAFWPEIVAAFADLDSRSDVRCVVLSSTGKHFTAGLDLAMAASALSPKSPDPARANEFFRRTVKRMQESFSVIDRCRVPVIAVVQGGCIGGGVDLVTACDMRIGTADCFFTIQEINIGIVADVGTLQRLPYLLPQGLVRELAYTGRRMMSEEACRVALLNSAHADAPTALAAAMALAHDIASKAPVAIAGIKQVLNAGRSQSIEDGLDYVATWNAAMLMGQDLQEAVAAQMQKRIANYENLLGQA
jgi:enoyl-CoA hydratase